MSMSLEGEVVLKGIAADGAETLVRVDLAELAPAHTELTVNDFTSIPPSPFIDALAAKLREAVVRTAAMLSAGL